MSSGEWCEGLVKLIDAVRYLPHGSNYLVTLRAPWSCCSIYQPSWVRGAKL